MPSPLPSVTCVGALYSGSERGLAADVLAARHAGLAPHTVCTAIVAASHGAVTDLTEVPVDTVRSQLEHLGRVAPPEAVRIGVLGSDKNAVAVLDWASGVNGPVILEFVASGPSGETVLPARGIDRVAERLGAADLVMLSRQDAELVTGGQIASLDDAQVAAQRVTNRGAKRVAIDCGVLPARFFDAADDPGGDGAAGPLAATVVFDGEDFVLLEYSATPKPPGLKSLWAITALSSRLLGHDWEACYQVSTRETVEASRAGTLAASGETLVGFDWELQADRQGP